MKAVLPAVPIEEVKEEVEKKTWLYCILAKETGLVKLGISTVPYKRLLALEAQDAIGLELVWCVPGGREDEKAVHELFKAVHHHGEWFHVTPEILNLCKGEK